MPIVEPTLAEAIAPHTTATSDAAIWIATVEDEAELTTAIAAHARDAPNTPFWVANRKGKATPYGDTAIRAVMRTHSYIDTKSCAVSEHWSATRYGRR